jgi:hypothetical protein
MHFMRCLLVCTGLLLAGISCGGDGDDSFFSGVALVDVSAIPAVIDVGETTYVEVEVDDVDVDRHSSFFLKVRYPAGLSYVSGSSELDVAGEIFNRSPDRQFFQDGYEYIVYFISAIDSDFEDDFKLIFRLRGNSRISSGQIEVDPDVDDGSIPNDVEFDDENPDFNSEEQTSIEVLE